MEWKWHFFCVWFLGIAYLFIKKLSKMCKTHAIQFLKLTNLICNLSHVTTLYSKITTSQIQKLHCYTECSLELIYHNWYLQEVLIILTSTINSFLPVLEHHINWRILYVFFAMTYLLCIIKVSVRSLHE